MGHDIQALIKEMTLEEKAGLCSGFDFWNTKAIERLGIPSVMMSDGPHGLRKQENEADHLGMKESIKAVCFPAACATAASFDTALLEKMGETIGNECQAEKLSIILGPGVNIKRSPLCGRNFEYFSEDPYLTGKLASAFVRGVQKENIGTSLKHFAVNSQETNRMSVSSRLSERAFREIYLRGFEEVVKTAKPKTVMCSYNKINDVYASENKYLLNDILREEWGFEGYVVTDWGAIANRVKGLQAGVELEMPASGGLSDAKIVKAVQDGSLDEAILDRAVERMLKVLFSYVDNVNENAVFDREKDHAIAEDIAAECAVLLKNDGVLPLKNTERILYVGEYAEIPRYQGGGSSHINVSKVTSALESANRKGRKITYLKGFSGSEDKKYDVEKVYEAAVSADKVVIFAGLPDSYETEGIDRTNMKMPAVQNEMISELAKRNPNTVVVLHNGSVIECPWADDVAGILEMYLGGQGVGEATDRILFGEVNPSGRLPETFPYRLQDNPSYLNFPGNGKNVNYAEDIYVGYRYYDAKEIPVRWAFGHGLSYTEFEYSNIQLSNLAMKDDETVTVSVDVENIGKVGGKETVQLYISDKTKSINREVKALRGFQKIFLAPGEKQSVSFQINAEDLAYYNEDIRDWYAASGEYEILIAHASDDIRLSAALQYENSVRLPLRVDMATTFKDLIEDDRSHDFANSIIAEGLKHSTIAKESESISSPEEIAMMTAMMEAMPIKSLVSFGVLTEEQGELLIRELDGLK
ncbi:MAG: glycoside hydrolase family 3 C-terminal domain-containing protein [Blautia sp.]|nr:glycoside hydrolase family 3 C-terminal domain-containing protein [Lachnoclostridium sp.]MCM1211422.1 glycoside hydrolase family 3 C-terminal domain-containing protein [Blautia sp.]